MNQSFKALAVAAVLCLLAVPLAAQSTATDLNAQSPDTRAQNLLTHPRLLARFLHLTASQASQLQTLWNTLQSTSQPLREARGPLCDALRADLADNSPSDSAVGADAIAVFNNKQELRDAAATFDADFSAILTPEQLAKYEALKQIAHLDEAGEYNPLGACPPAS
jgi:Spy/CpxP family protein refolding chaperone